MGDYDRLRHQQSNDSAMVRAQKQYETESKEIQSCKGCYKLHGEACIICEDFSEWEE